MSGSLVGRGGVSGLVVSSARLDVVVFMGLAAALSWLERRSWTMKLFTIPVAGLVALFAAANAAYMFVAGEQSSYEAIADLVKRHKEALMVLEESVSDPWRGAVAGLLAIAVIVAPIGLRRLTDRLSIARAPAGRARARAHGALALAVVAAVAHLILPQPRSIEARMLGQNALAVTLRTGLSHFNGGGFQGWDPAPLATEESVKRLAAKPASERPNVLMVVLESTRWDYTSLAGDASMADTPNLARLAARGFVASQARSVLPHTTKSMFSFHCGQFPTMQKGVIEVSADTPVACLPAMLREAGYQTGFFQSAFGTFEQRPRLVDKFGYDHFEAWEDIHGHRLGYLASADASMVPPLLKWIDGIKDDVGDRPPFMATILTSATHHPYRLPPPLHQRMYPSGPSRKRPEQHYAMLVNEADRVLGEVLDGLRERNLAENTLVVVLGDHGEGFGDHGIRQHDNNFFEEGLHVPLVIAGPGVPRRRLEANASLVDVPPTLLALLGLESPEDHALEGFDMLDPAFPTDQPRWFGCFADTRCRGFVLGHQKVVWVPQDDLGWYFDLAEDPDERDPRPLTAAQEMRLPDLDRVIDARRVREKKNVYRALSTYPGWQCAVGSKRCTHPGAFKRRNRPTPSKPPQEL